MPLSSTTTTAAALRQSAPGMPNRGLGRSGWVDVTGTGDVSSILTNDAYDQPDDLHPIRKNCGLGTVC